MESPLPFALRVAAGVVAESLEAVRRLPTDLSTLPVSVMGRVAKLSFQLNQQLGDLASAGDRLLGSRETEEEPPQRTAWSTIDDEDEIAANDPQAAPTWDDVAEAVEESPARQSAAAGSAAAAAVADEPAAQAARHGRAPAPRPAKRTARPMQAVPDIPAAADTGTSDDRSDAVDAAGPAGVEDLTRDLVDDVRRLEVQAPATRTLAQLRSAVRTMSIPELEAALADEQQGRARPAHLTLLGNRLSTLGRSAE